MNTRDKLIAATCSAFIASPVLAQTRLNSVNGPGPTFAYPGMTYGTTTGNTYYRGVTPMPNPYGPYYGGYGIGNPALNPYGYGVPTLMNNGFYHFNLGPVGVNMWRSPSGYYYPWAGGGGYGGGYSSTTILYSQQASATPQAAQPPISTMVKDMVSFLDESKEKNRIDEADYTHLRRRVMDLQSKESLLMSNGNGSLDPQDEQQLRTDLTSVSGEIMQRVKPVH